MNEKQLKKHSEEAFHSQRMLIWAIIDFIALIILAASIIYCRFC